MFLSGYIFFNGLAFNIFDKCCPALLLKGGFPGILGVIIRLCIEEYEMG